VLTVDTPPSEADNRRIKLHFAEAAVERLREGSAPANALFPFNLFAIDSAGLEKIRRLHVEHYQRSRDLIAACTSPDQVVLMNLQLVPLARTAAE
jgi:hypothetical protein